MGLRINSISELGKGAWSVSGTASQKLTNDADKDQAKKKKKAAKSLSSTMSPPQAKLWGLVKMAWPSICQSEYKNAVPGRKFTLDIVFEDSKTAVEVDGWGFHGRFKAGFHRDREKDKLLMLEGWKVVRFTAKEINKDAISCLRVIEKIIGIKSAINLN